MSLLQALGMVRDKGMPLQQLEILLLLGQADEPLNQPRNITIQLNPAWIEFLKHFYELSAR